jgi:TfoX/Sxy family transcriptional regulator of competence genes
MTDHESLVKRVKEALGSTRPVQEKRMFGGITFMVGGKMCVSVGKERIMCRIDPAIHDTALRRSGCRTVVMKGREYRGFVHVDADAVKTKAGLNFWVALALDYNKKIAGSARKRMRPRATQSGRKLEAT